MALTFGAATSDRVVLTTPRVVHSDSDPLFMYGWFYPTTLTAGRHYISCGAFSTNFSGVRVGSTTSELEWTSDFSTTKPVWGTSGAGITVDKWWFIACLTNGTVTGPNDGCQIWLGDAENCPVALTPTRSTAPVGSPATTTIFTIGNGFNTGANVAFRGDIADAGWVCADTWASNAQTTHLLGQTASNGDVDAGMIDYTYEHWVKHLWANEYPYHEIGKFESSSGSRWNWTHWCGIGTGDIALQRGYAFGGGYDRFNPPTVTGATLSARRHPRAYRTNLMVPPPLARRR